MSSIIHISVDNSQADEVIAQTLISVINVEEKTDVVEADVLKMEVDIDLLLQDSLELVASAANIEAMLEQEIEDQREIESRVYTVEAKLKEMKVEVVAVEKKAETVLNKIQTSNIATVSNIRRTAAFAGYMFQAVGFGIGQTLSLLTETIAFTIETAKYAQGLDYAAAFTNPLSAASVWGGLAVRVSLIVGLIMLQVQLHKQKGTVSAEFNAIIGGLRILSI